MMDFNKQRICIKFCFKLEKTAAEIHHMLQEVFGDNAMSQKKPFSGTNSKKTCHVYSHVKSMFIIFFNIHGIVHKGFLPSGQTISGKFTVRF